MVGSNFEILLDSVLTCLVVVAGLLEGFEVDVVVFEVGVWPEELLEGLSDELLEGFSDELLEGFSDELIEDWVTQIPVPFIPSSHIPVTQEQVSLQFGPKIIRITAWT